MAWRAALQAVLLFFPTCSAISFTRKKSGAADAEPQPAVPAAEAECQEARVGTPCSESVDWLRTYGLSKHPEWYPGYTSESTFEEVQDLLHGLGKVNCPKPCFIKKPLADNCRDVVEGGCYDSILWLKRYGLEKHRDWYPSLQPSSSVSEIQAELHRTGKVSCPQPCALTKTENTDVATMMGVEQSAVEAKPEAARAAPREPTGQCMDAKPSTPCYSAVIYGINEGISKYPHMYVGFTANGGLNFKKVQEYLYLQARPSQEPCGMPCPTEQVDLETLAEHPESLRVKKRVEDMSMNELSDFFNGNWDGYVSKILVGDWQQQPTTTFEKRMFDLTTTVAEDQLPEYKLPLPEVVDDSYEMGTAPMNAANGTEETEAAIDNVLEAAPEAAAENANAPEEAAENATAPVEAAENATAPVVAANTTEETEAASVTEHEEAANGTEHEEAANGTVLDPASEAAAETATAPVEAANTTEEPEAASVAEHEEAAKVTVSAEVEDEGIVDEPTPEVASLEVANVSEEVVVAQDEDIVDEPMPDVDGQGHDVIAEETREEMEQRIRKQLMDEMQLQTTTVRETEEVMRQRLREELMREMMPKGQ